MRCVGAEEEDGVICNRCREGGYQVREMEANWRLKKLMPARSECVFVESLRGRHGSRKCVVERAVDWGERADVSSAGRMRWLLRSHRCSTPLTASSVPSPPEPSRRAPWPRSFPPPACSLQRSRSLQSLRLLSSSLRSLPILPSFTRLNASITTDGAQGSSITGLLLRNALVSSSIPAT